MRATHVSWKYHSVHIISLPRFFPSVYYFQGMQYHYCRGHQYVVDVFARQYNGDRDPGRRCGRIVTYKPPVDGLKRTEFGTLSKALELWEVWESRGYFEVDSRRPSSGRKNSISFQIAKIYTYHANWWLLLHQLNPLFLLICAIQKNCNSWKAKEYKEYQKNLYSRLPCLSTCSQ